MLQACDASTRGGGDDGADDVAARSGAVDVAGGVASCVGVAAICESMENVLIIRLGNVHACQTCRNVPGKMLRNLGIFDFPFPPPHFAHGHCYIHGETATIRIVVERLSK